MSWLTNNYILRGIADFMVSVGVAISLAVVNPEPGMYKGIPYGNFSARTEDGVLIKGTQLRQKAPAGDTRPVVIVVHGIAISRKNQQIMEISRDICGKFDVIAIDLRGHGESTGEFTGGETEAYDVAAAVNYAKKCGYEKIGVISFSAGGIAAIKEQEKNHNLKAMVIVASPSCPEKAKGEMTKLLCTDQVFLQAAGKAFMTLRNSRIKVPLKVGNALNSVDKVNCPILFMQGKNDWIVDSDQSRILYEKAKEPKKLVILDSTEHAECLYNDKRAEFRAAAMDWFDKYLN